MPQKGSPDRWEQARDLDAPDPPSVRYRGPVTRNTAGQAQHIVANYRPRSSLLLLSRLVDEKLAGTTLARHFAASES
jgi:hypothetical protein